MLPALNSRQQQRLEAVTRSPVYSLLSETLDGLVTIRAFSVQREYPSRARSPRQAKFSPEWRPFGGSVCAEKKKLRETTAVDITAVLFLFFRCATKPT